MKQLLLLALLFSAVTASAATYESVCDVTLCNRIKRFSLNPFSHLKDKMGEMCFGAQILKSEAVAGHELSSESRWYQGSSINPTKRSVVYVREVHGCR